jgi:phage terminase large subunit-like protein
VIEAPSASPLLSAAEKCELLALLEERERRRKRRKLWTYYPDSGPLRRALYPKHLAFFAAGARHRERLMLAANRIGKTEGIGGYETTLHLTGLYPEWWEGRRFIRPVRAWMAGKTNETTRDILQMKMFGETRYLFGRKHLAGTGLVPGEALGAVAWKQGVTGLVDHLKIRHVSGGWSVLGVKSYQQGRRSFEGTEQDVVWLDEEPPLEIYTECVVRTMTTDGLILLTFTPLEGMSEVVLSFLPGGKIPGDEDREGEGA